jgi:peroxiredoxin
VSIAVDSPAELASDVQRFGIRSTYLSDEDGQVSRTYGIPLTHGGEPGHTFVLVGKDGFVKWIKDYAAPENGGLMYVEVEELYREVAQNL